MLDQWLQKGGNFSLNERILNVDVAVAQRSARLHVPNPRPVHDGLIAATALVHGMTVLRRIVADFEPVGIAVLNRWKPLSALET